MTIFTFMAVVGLGVLSTPALHELALKQGYSEVEADRIDRVLASAAEMNLPVEPLFHKAQEGMAKHIAAPVLESVLAAQVARLHEVFDGLPKSFRSAAGAQSALTALASGSSAESVQVLARAAETGRRNELVFEASLYAHGVLRAAGSSDAEAREFVATQVGARLDPDEIDTVTRVSAQALRAGLVSGKDLASTPAAALQGASRRGFLERLSGVRSPMLGTRPDSHDAPGSRARERGGESHRFDDFRRRDPASPAGVGTPSNPPPAAGAGTPGSGGPAGGAGGGTGSGGAGGTGGGTGGGQPPEDESHPPEVHHAPKN